MKTSQQEQKNAMASWGNHGEKLKYGVSAQTMEDIGEEKI